MSKDGTRIGSLAQVVKLKARIAELEAELAADHSRPQRPKEPGPRCPPHLQEQRCTT